MGEILKAQARLDVGAGPDGLKVRTTPQGGILADCFPTRCGVLHYTYPDGRKVRELRHPDEVFRADSLESLKGAPVTIGHPDVPVTTENWSSLVKGTVSDDVRRNDGFVAASVRVNDASTVKDIRSRRLKEMSCGYDADVEFEPGVYNGEHYDAVQRNIRYNHVALLPVGRGRAGREVGLKLDSVPYSEDMTVHLDEGDKPTVTFDADKFVSRADHDKAIGTKSGEIEDLRSKLSAATARADAAEALVKPEALDKLVNARVELVQAAAKIVGKDFKSDGKSAHEIRLEAVKSARPTMKLDGVSEAFVEGVFAGLAATAAETADKQETVASVLVSQKKDSGEDPIALAAKKREDHFADLYNKKGAV